MTSSETVQPMPQVILWEVRLNGGCEEIVWIDIGAVFDAVDWLARHWGILDDPA